jgi:hypothetical protein
VLAAVAKVFGNHDVSIGSVIQKRAEGGSAQIVCVMHSARETDVRAALAEIEALDVVEAVAAVIRVEALAPWARRFSFRDVGQPRPGFDSFGLALDVHNRVEAELASGAST